MKLMTIPAAALAATFVFAQSAQAREYHRHHGLHREVDRQWSWASAPFGQQQESAGSFWNGSEEPASARSHRRVSAQRSASNSWNDAEATTYHAGSASPASQASVGGRPSAWCGWEMRQLVGGDPGPEYNLARNWAHWGQGGPVGVGAVVVWPHHVGKIVGQEDGNWVIESGNDGHALRTRPRSIAGAIAIRWG